MPVFISWSGNRSKAVAKALRTLVQNVNGNLDPWVSDSDIAAGTRWREELDRSLKSATFGIVCASRLTLNSPWVLFETGALSIALKSRRICPYLIDVNPSDVKGPLSEFQSCIANKEGTWNLVMALNVSSDIPPLSESILKERFIESWPEFETEIHAAPVEQSSHLDRPSPNCLNETGLLNLLKIHFDASADRLYHLFCRYLEESHNDPSQMNLDLLIMDTKRVIEEGRLLLAPFHIDLIGPVPTFLDVCLPASELHVRIEEGLAIASRSHDPSKWRKAVYQLIRNEQTNLMRIIRNRLTKQINGIM